MADLGKTNIVAMWTVPADDVAEGDRIFESHGKWMTGHSREGDTALLSYKISKGPELSNPLDPNSEADRQYDLRAQRDLRVTRGCGRALEARGRELAGFPGLYGLGRGQGRHAAQRNGRRGPLVGQARERGPAARHST